MLCSHISQNKAIKKLLLLKKNHNKINPILLNAIYNYDALKYMIIYYVCTTAKIKTLFHL